MTVPAARWRPDEFLTAIEGAAGFAAIVKGFSDVCEFLLNGKAQLLLRYCSTAPVRFRQYLCKCISGVGSLNSVRLPVCTRLTCCPAGSRLRPCM
jgi:hypothetical protein